MNRIPGALLKAALAMAVAGLAAQAETFYNKDGVVFEGTIRRVVSGAAVCNVLEEKYSEQEYEKLKANQGQPLDLWQVDFTIRNESGREIEYLRASSWMHSEHPPCTNWSGQGPGGGPVLPEPSLPIPIEWGDYSPLLQKPSGMRPGQQERTSVYVLAWHEHRPRFGEWDIDYDFAKEAAAGKEPAAGASRMPVSGGATSTAPAGSESQENLFWQSIMNSTAAADFEAYLRQFPNGIFRVLAQNRLAALRGSASDPPVTAGATAAPSASRVESRAPQPPRQAEEGRPSGISAGQTCAGQAEGAACWKELESHPGCRVWDDHHYADQTVTWTGGCSGGLASGTGTLKWVRGSEANEHSGLLQDGKHTGDWVLRFAGGIVVEGPYVDGKLHGDWVIRDADGNVEERTYVDGKLHGRWVTRLADGTVDEGSYVDGNKHGRWVERDADGNVTEESYVDGKLHGRWVFRHASGRVEEGSYVDGNKHGRWVEDVAGNVLEGPYVDGNKHGRWVMRLASGTVYEGPYVDGERHGRWVIRYADGTVKERTYVNGERQ